MRYDLIYVDPPWWFAKRGGGRIKDVREHYEVAPLATMMTWEHQFKYLAGHGPSVMLMWATKSHLAGAIDLMDAWGYRYATMFLTWAKLTKKGEPFKGPGTYLGSNAEYLLLGQRHGQRAVLPDSPLVAPDVLLTGRLPHSAKPPEARAIIERCFAGTRKVEVFAREHAPGWHAIGLEIGGEAHRINPHTLVEVR